LVLIEDQDWQEAQRRFALIRPLLSASVRSRELVAEVAGGYGVHLTTVYRWIRLYESTRRVSSLVPTKRDGGRGRSRLDPEVEKIIRATIEDFYLSKQQRSMQQTCTEVERRCRNAGITPPHPNTVRNRITALTDRVKMERRRGKRAARQQFAPSVGHFPGADWPLSVVQIDHKLRQYFIIPYRDTSHPPISLWEMREVRRQLEQEGREQVDENLIFDAYERMRAQEEQSVGDTRRVRRAQARRAHHSQAEKPARVIQAAFGQAASGAAAADVNDVPDVEPFEELEELS